VISGTPVRTGTTLFFELGSNACASVGAKWMTVKYHSFKINYACFTQQPRVARPQNCIKDAVYLYSTGATVSGLRRRLELEAREEAAQLALQKMRCPAGLTACHVSNNPEHGFECLDTTVELESCGGCLYGEFGANSTLSVGTDCSSLPDVRAATCVQGECAVTACRDGRKPINGVC
jgi:hypothetical protein